MKCTHNACWVDREGREHRVRLPGLDTSCYATGDVVTAGGKHYELGAAHREHYGTGDGALDVSWMAVEIPGIASHLTRARD